MAVYTAVDDSGAFYSTLRYSGDGVAIGAGGMALTGVGFAPNFGWFKDYSGIRTWGVFDTVRGVEMMLKTQTNAGEGSAEPETVAVFGADGYTFGNDSVVNNASGEYLSFNWKAGTTSGITGGTITPSSYSINTTSGFGIYAYTGDDTAGATIAHGLGAVPTFYMLKRLSAAADWTLFHRSNGGTKYIVLNSNGGVSTNSNAFNDTDPTSTVFSLGSGSDVNSSSHTYIAYVFCDVTGYSKAGGYTGNGNADGTFIFTGFRPAYVLVKRNTGSADWFLVNNKRLGYNPDNDSLYPNSTGGSSTVDFIEILSNGFKMRNVSVEVNGAEDYIYIAFAESPFVNSSGVATNAR